MQALRHARDVLRFVATHEGVRGARGRAIWRAVRWQLSKRMGARRALVRVGSARLYCYPDSTAASGVLYVGLPEWDDMMFALRYLRPGDHFIDVGANVGTYGVLAAAYRPGIELTAVEPAAEACARLEENLRLNHLTHARVIQAGAGRSAGTARITTELDTCNRVLGPSETGGLSVPVPMVTVDDLAAGRPPALIKVDVEGMELEVFEGAVKTMSGSPPPVVIFEALREGEADNAPLGGWLASRGYELFQFRPGVNRLEPYRSRDRRRGNNLIAVHDPGRVTARLSEPAASLPLRPPLTIEVSIERG